MNWFKRLLMFVFGLAGLLALATLCLTWVGPWTAQARSYLELTWFFTTLEVLVCISAVGLLGCVLVSLFAPRNPKETVVAEVAGGQITVTRAAIASQAKHVVEADGTCMASSVGVRVRKRGHVRVHVRVTPRRPVNVVERGAELYAELHEGLSRVCGESIQSIDVVFTEPEQPELTHPYVTSVASDGDTTPTSSAEHEITVPVSTLVNESEQTPQGAAEDKEDGPNDQVAPLVTSVEGVVSAEEASDQEEEV